MYCKECLKKINNQINGNDIQHNVGNNVYNNTINNNNYNKFCPSCGRMIEDKIKGCSFCNNNLNEINVKENSFLDKIFNLMIFLIIGFVLFLFFAGLIDILFNISLFEHFNFVDIFVEIFTFPFAYIAAIFLVLGLELDGFAFLIVSVIVIALILFSLLYFIRFIINLFINFSPSCKKKVILILLILIVIIFGVFGVRAYLNNNDLNYVLDNSYSYFIYNDKIYYHTFNYDYDSKNSDKLYVMDLDGSNKKLIVKDEKLRYADFYFVYNDEAYYYSTFYQENRKVNLNSGEITFLNNNDIYNQNTLNKNFVYSFVSTPYSLYNNNHFKKVDLLNNKVIDDVKIDWQSTLSNYYLDYNNVDVYYYNGFTENSGIYKNNDYLYKFNEENNADLVFLGVEKNYLYYFYNSKIYKLNIDTQNIEGEFNFNVKKIYRLDSMIGCNYFYFNNKIHEFDFINNTFKLVVDNIEKQPNFVYKINNKLIFTENVYNLNYYVPEHVSKNILGSITVYDLNNKTTNKYDSVTKFSYDDNFLYIMLEKNDEYFVEKISVN